MPVMLVQSVDYSRLRHKIDPRKKGETMNVLFTRDWRGFRVGKVYDLDKPMGDLLVARGFAVISLPENKPKKRKRKSTNNGSGRKRHTKRSTSN